MLQNEKKYVVITGASSGIGWEAAKAFAARGKNLILIARRGDRLEALRAELLGRRPQLDVVVRAADLSVWENARRTYESLRAYRLETWVNCAGFGNYSLIAEQDLAKTEALLRVDLEAVTLLSTLFVRDYRYEPGAQLMNVSSCGGYTIVPTAVTYCAAKFYVSAFTEGLARELLETGAAMRAKVFAPAAVKTEFGKNANDVAEYDYEERFGTYHTSAQAAAFLLQLYDSEETVGLVDRETFEFRLCGPLFSYAGESGHNQRMS